MTNRTKLSLAIIVGLSFVSALYMIAKNESNTYAQVKSGEVPKPETKDYLSAEEKGLLKNMTSIADKVEKIIAEKEPKWKLEQKRTSVGSGVVPFGTALTSSRWENNGSHLSIKVFMDKSNEDASEKLKFGVSGISRGVVNSIPNIGDECLIVTDHPTAPSTTVNLSFRKGKILIDVGLTNQSKKRVVNEKEVKKFAKILDTVIETPVEH